MDYSVLDDASLVAMIAQPAWGIAAGMQQRKDAFSALYDRHARLVFSVAFTTLSDRGIAEEITQDVFMRVWNNAGTYRPETAQVRTWLVSITRHRAIDEFRRRGARREQDQVDWPEEDRNLDKNLHQESPVEPVEGSIQRQVIRKAVAGLPEEQKQILGLAFFNGLTHQEIADQLGTPLGTVKSRIRLALVKVRESLNEGQV